MLKRRRDQWKEALSDRLEPRQLNFPECRLFFCYNFYQRCSYDRIEGRSRFWGWSITSENRRAMLERILHMSIYPPSFSRTPYDHLSISYNKFPKFQFHILGRNWFSSFYNLDTGFLVIFLTCSRSLRYYLTPSASRGEFPMGGSLSMAPFSCWFCILLRALEWVDSSPSKNLILSLSSWFSLSRAQFSALSCTNFSKISETCFLVGDRASCSSFKLSCNRLISACRS